MSESSKLDIKSLDLPELTEWVVSAGLPKFRAGQIYKWLHQNFVSSFSEMTNLPKALRQQLEESCEIKNCTVEKKLVSHIDATVKYLFRLCDGEMIESVVMKYKYGYSICVSSQVGCRMGCRFCASTVNGLKRNLYPSEILSQIYAAQNDLNIRVSHIVLMGMGEPLDNYAHVIKFLKLVNDDNGIHISMRNISLSTCGIVPRMLDLMDLDLQLTLSVSLHAPNDEIRGATMPVNRKWNIDEVLEACRKYAAKTSRRISFEYTLIDGVNDSEACAAELSSRLKGLLCHVNLIPVNEVSESGFQKSSSKNIEKFMKMLKKSGINATIRRTLGSDINASCGQLRRSMEN